MKHPFPRVVWGTRRQPLRFHIPQNPDSEGCETFPKEVPSCHAGRSKFHIPQNPDSEGCETDVMITRQRCMSLCFKVPQTRIWFVELFASASNGSVFASFNPSVGIIWSCGTPQTGRIPTEGLKDSFQSLSRGFWFVELGSRHGRRCVGTDGFNPSVGILVCGTAERGVFAADFVWFHIPQNRDSEVCGTFAEVFRGIGP